MKKLLKSAVCLCLISIIIVAGTISSMAIDVSNTTPDSYNSHLKQKVSSVDGSYDTHQWVTDYDETNQTSYYCYPYALGVTEKKFTPADTIAQGTFFNTLRSNYVDVNQVANWVLTDLKKLGASGRILTGSESNPYYKTKNNEYLIALRVTGKNDYVLGNPDTYNYHFMRKISNDCWRYKAGVAGKVIQLEQGYTPEDVTWDTIILKSNKTSQYDYVQERVGYYSSDIVYIVVTQNSPFNIDNNTFPYVGVKSVYLKKDSIKLGIGASYFIEPVFNPSNATDQNIFWSVSNANKKIATIDSYNKLITKSAGSYTTKGLCNGNKSYILNFSVEVVNTVLGDVDMDGEITLKDASLVQRYLNGLETLTEKQLFAADTDSNGIINIYDAALIQKYNLKIIEAFPVEQ